MKLSLDSPEYIFKHFKPTRSYKVSTLLASSLLHLTQESLLAIAPAVSTTKRPDRMASHGVAYRISQLRVYLCRAVM